MAPLDHVPDCLIPNEVIPHFQRFPIVVSPSEAEKNDNAAIGATAPVALPPVPKPNAGLFLANISSVVDQDSLTEIMKFYGPLELVKLIGDGTKPGYAFVTYVTQESAQIAMAALAGVVIAGSSLVVQVAREETRTKPPKP